MYKIGMHNLNSYADLYANWNAIYRIIKFFSFFSKLYVSHLHG